MLLFQTSNSIGMLRRKTLVLDLDETLIHSHHDGVIRQTVKPGTPPDFVLKVMIDRHPVSQWYELVVFTASMEIYGAAVADRLDNSRGILKRRYYRQSHIDNAIPITSWFSEATDTALLCLLPLLDALRFCNDVRSVLSRNLHKSIDPVTKNKYYLPFKP
ncbi:CNEPA-like protein [Mya arenaria]|uniref:Mitochondrial import inner membrane translocase subunit TIM50 n=1 Tax=Mya arenaria TaxID=6604 RepID=A0ABY7EYV0_MYAAR|nr:CNEPA-like protein [Mya arenaria]